MISTYENLGAPKAVTAEQIEKACGVYDAEFILFEETIAKLKAELQEIQNKYLREIKRQAAIVASREAELHSLIEQAPHLFKSPRTIVFHGVKVGFTKSTGSVVWTDAEQVMRLIRQKFSDREKELIRTSEEPNKQTLKEMGVDDLKKVACRIEGAGDVVVLTRTAGDVEKMFNGMVKNLVAAIVEGDK